MKKQELIQTLESQLPGFYSVEQVIGFIKSIEESTALSEDSIASLKQQITAAVVDSIDDASASDVIDFSSACFELNCNEIELESVELCTREIRGLVEEAVDEAFNEFFEKD